MLSFFVEIIEKALTCRGPFSHPLFLLLIMKSSPPQSTHRQNSCTTTWSIHLLLLSRSVPQTVARCGFICSFQDGIITPLITPLPKRIVIQESRERRTQKHPPVECVHDDKFRQLFTLQTNVLVLMALWKIDRPEG